MRMQTMIRNHPRPEHGGAAHPLLTDSPARSDPATFTAAIRMALGDRVAASERDALARAIIAVVPLNNDARVSGSFGAAGHLHLLVDGWAYRANGLRDGSRQITDILLPGDICDWTPPAPNEDIRVCGPARVAVLPRPADAASLQGLARTREVATATELRRLRALRRPSGWPICCATCTAGWRASASPGTALSPARSRRISWPTCGG